MAVDDSSRAADLRLRLAPSGRSQHRHALFLFLLCPHGQLKKWTFVATSCFAQCLCSSPHSDIIFPTSQLPFSILYPSGSVWMSTACRRVVRLLVIFANPCLLRSICALKLQNRTIWALKRSQAMSQRPLLNARKFQANRRFRVAGTSQLPVHSAPNSLQLSPFILGVSSSIMRCFLRRPQAPYCKFSMSVFCPRIPPSFYQRHRSLTASLCQSHRY